MLVAWLRMSLMTASRFCVNKRPSRQRAGCTVSGKDARSAHSRADRTHIDGTVDDVDPLAHDFRVRLWRGQVPVPTIPPAAGSRGSAAGQVKPAVRARFALAASAYTLHAVAHASLRSLASLKNCVRRLPISASRVDMLLTSEHASARRAIRSVVVSKASTSFGTSCTVCRVASSDRRATFATSTR